MVIVEGYIWYYICNRNNCEYPIWKPSSLFEVLDGRMSKCWVFSCLKYNAEDYDTLWAYPEWVNDPYYYDQLTNGEEEYVKNFRKYKVLMDKEFPDPSVQQTAEIGDEKWLICPKCVDAWESSTIEDAMVTCPMCKTIYHNPRYKNDDSYQFKVVNMNH
ncbi:hypothetical protein pah_c006o003 [Parachlamydia acanthamoebae str. Hall's coccus]|nr:hypothetical protein pah_c006o003 [Parachlamydia acanthamoebae str. Hall's coccus]